MTHAPRLQQFLTRFDALVERANADEARLLDEGAALLAGLVAHDDWLPASHARAGADGYRQYLLHLDAQSRYCVVSFVWGPGQHTPVHDHTVWGLIGVLRGAEVSDAYRVGDRSTGPMIAMGSHRLEAGQVDRVSPRIGDIHAVANALSDRASISIHIYGADIGRVERHIFDVHTGETRGFVSGYHDATDEATGEASA